VTIYKFPLKVVDKQTVMLPHKARVLGAAVQGGVLCIWALLDPKEKAAPRPIFIHGTGHEVDHWQSKRFIGTVLMAPFVWHVFEEGAYNDR
jgi:hypothetical protein